MVIIKFGGTSVSNAKNMEKARDIIAEASTKGRLIVVVSAAGGVTDALIQCAERAAAGDESFSESLTEIESRHLSIVQELMPLDSQSSLLSTIKKMNNELDEICNGVFLLGELSARARDRIISYGELMSSRILTAICEVKKMDASWVDARKGIVTDSTFGTAVVNYEQSYIRIRKQVEEATSRILIYPGFIAADPAGITTTLGRGGSDFSAAIIGAAVKAEEVQIWTDVSGMMTADPRLVAHARVIPSLSYLEAMELSHFGAKVVSDVCV